VGGLGDAKFEVSTNRIAERTGSGRHKSRDHRHADVAFQVWRGGKWASVALKRTPGLGGSGGGSSKYGLSDHLNHVLEFNFSQRDFIAAFRLIE
jgi:hypothetical protein